MPTATGNRRPSLGATVVEQTLQDPEPSPAPPAGSRPPAAGSRTVTPARAGRPTRIRWVIAGFCFAGLAINYIDRSALSVALPFMTHDLSLTPPSRGSSSRPSPGPT